MPMSLAKKLSTARRKAGLSMSEAARKSRGNGDPRGRITQGYISRLESGRETNPSYLKIKTLCRIYKIQPATLFSR